MLEILPSLWEMILMKIFFLFPNQDFPNYNFQVLSC